MRPYEFIKTKRDGLPLNPEDIRAFIRGFTDGVVPEYQMAAMCMAIFFRGLTPAELQVWTESMLHSGEVVDLSDIPGVKVDKHSTGGVGDKVSLALAPLVAVCGVPVPMVSGRGLGHTGGTLDKLESIPGFRVNLPLSEYRKLLRQVGACLIGQTGEIAPADKKLYALRDVTATVDCVPLIASSIMSKKLAEGIDALVLDVKVGSGAFMKDHQRARELATTLIGLGQGLGKKVVAVITDMDQPLGCAIGNALEVKEAVAVLQGQAPRDLTECTLELSAQMLVLGKKAANIREAHQLLNQAVASGAAFQKFCEIVQAQGGDVRAVEDLSRLASAREVIPLPSPDSGFVASIDAEALGLAAMTLGAGRERIDSVIDPAVGLMLRAKVGDRVAQGEPLLDLHCNDTARLEEVKQKLWAAYRIAPVAPEPRPLIMELLT